MGISITTIRGYWLRIRAKLGAGSRAQLTASAAADRASDKLKIVMTRAHDAVVLARESEDGAKKDARKIVADILNQERRRHDSAIGKLDPDIAELLEKIRAETDKRLDEAYDSADIELADSRKNVDENVAGNP